MSRQTVPFLALCSAWIALGCGGADHAEARPKLKSDADKTLYSLGRITGRALARRGLSLHELEIVQLGITDQVLGHDSVVDIEHFAKRIPALGPTKLGPEAQAERDRAKAFESAAAREPGAIRDESGSIYRSLKEGQGAQPSAGDVLSLNYEGTFVDGKVFTSSTLPGSQTEFHGDKLIRCWADAVSRMRVGGKARAVCPPSTAYGDLGRPPKIPGGATLAFVIELVAVHHASPP